MRFGASQRLRKASDFAYLRQEGSRYNCGSFVLIGVKREQGVPVEIEESVPAERAGDKNVAAPTSDVPAEIENSKSRNFENSRQETGDRETKCVPAARAASREWAVGSNPSFPRFAVIASKKLVGNHAVDRNRAKRIFRAIFQKNQAAFPRDFDFLVIARKAVLREPFSKLEANFLAGTRFLAEKLAQK